MLREYPQAPILKGRRACFLPFFIILTLMMLIPHPSIAGSGTAPVCLARYSGPVVPITARYCERAIRYAESIGATACIIELNTPGGLYTTTQELVTTIVNAKVPVVVYVGPAGGWAGSAGTFITMAAHVAAMAPGSRIGAAHPVGIGPSEEEQSIPSEKITEDAAAWIRSIAQMRGRNARAAELAVRQSRSYSDEEALRLKLIDLRARDLKDLLAKLDGRAVVLSGGTKVILKTRGATVEEVPMKSWERLLLALSNPDIAYILMTIGMAGLMVEIYHPGLIFPGVAGGISLLLGLYSLGTLDAYWGGILLIILAFALFIAEAFVPSHGALGAGGIVSFVIGSLILFSNGPPGMGVSISLIIATAAVLTALMALLVTAVVRGQRRNVVTGSEALIGSTAVARTDLNPTGTVFVAGEIWNAMSESGHIRAGEEVVITGIEGLRLKVQRKA